MNPLISVIVPAYNNADTIVRALRSILDQTYRNLEVIVIDDHSTDDTRAVVEALAREDARLSYHSLTEEDPYRFDTRLKRNVNAGYAARNLGFSLAKGEYVTFQDGDDASLLNRIELQLSLLREFGAMHLSIDYLPFDERCLGKRIDAGKYRADHSDLVVSAQETYRLSQKAKGYIPKLLAFSTKAISFHIKRKRVLNRLFFGNFDPYPGAGNCALFAREVVDRVQFRPLRGRVWPSFMGRGADRDFNFQVAETFRKSVVVRVPAYLWDNRSTMPAPAEIFPYLS